MHDAIQKVQWTKEITLWQRKGGKGEPVAILKSDNSLFVNASYLQSTILAACGISPNGHKVEMVGESILYDMLNNA